MFRVSARTLLHLGGELISSDGIAFYELIKNAVDAGSNKVFVDVVMRMPHETIEEVKTAIRSASGSRTAKDKALVKAKEDLIEALAADIEDRAEWEKRITNTTEADELLSLLPDANSITFRDTGSGMTLKDLETVYLTVGTPHRLEERALTKAAGKKKVILGEKGIGRLAAMRLGSRIKVTTSTKEDSHWNTLGIDWTVFAADPNQFLEDIEIKPLRGKRKTDASHGTTIVVSDLAATWTIERLQQISQADLSRFSDPFAEKTRVTIHLRFNKTSVAVPRMSEILREQAHAIVHAQLSFEEGDKGEQNVILSGDVDYRFSGTTGAALEGRQLSFRYTNEEIEAQLPKKTDPDLDLEVVERLGSFSMVCYWFNRRVLKPLKFENELLDIKNLVKAWSGGLMVYRDGYRVPPYGGSDDDWLDLDRGALAAQGYKVNRAQLIGKVDIAADENPRLRDQTNREGLRDCPEKRALIALLKRVLEVEFRGYLKEIDDEIRDQERISFSNLAEQLELVEEKINGSLEDLIEIDNEHPDLEAGSIVKRLRSAYQKVVSVVGQMQDTVESAEGEKARLLHLAALGLSIEKLSHELNRATDHALEALKQINSGDDGANLRRTASLQLRSLQKRLQNLDPLLTPTRQKKEEFDLAREVRSVLDGYEAKSERHGITIRIEDRVKGPVMVKLVRAMLIQVLENLIENSMFWLTVGGKRNKKADESPEVVVVIDGRKNVLEVSDNGPGIAPENRDRILHVPILHHPNVE